MTGDQVQVLSPSFPFSSFCSGARSSSACNSGANSVVACRCAPVSLPFLPLVQMQESVKISLFFFPLRALRCYDTATAFFPSFLLGRRQKPLSSPFLPLDQVGRRRPVPLRQDTRSFFCRPRETPPLRKKDCCRVNSPSSLPGKSPLLLLYFRRKEAPRFLSTSLEISSTREDCPQF